MEAMANKVSASRWMRGSSDIVYGGRFRAGHPRSEVQCSLAPKTPHVKGRKRVSIALLDCAFGLRVWIALFGVSDDS